MRIVRIIDRYVFAEACGLFLVGFCGFLAFLLINKLFLEVQDLLNPNVPAIMVIQAVSLEAPNFTTMALPVAILFGTLMSMSRLAKDNELTAMFTNGISLYRLFLPFLLLSMIAVTASYLTNEYLLPRAAAIQQRIYDAYPQIVGNDNREPPPFIVKLENGEFVTASYFDKKQGVLSNVILDDWSTEGGKRLITSTTGLAEGETLVMGRDMGNPAILFRQDPNSGLYTGFTKEPTEQIPLGLDLKAQVAEIKTPQELTQSDLARQSKIKQQTGENPARDLTDFHLRFAGPFASLAFALVAMPLSLKAPREERLLGLIFCFVLVMVFYVLHFICKLMGYNEVLPPWLGAWLPNMTFAFIALLIFVYSRK